MEIIDACFGELLRGGKTILIFSGNFNESIRNYLDYLSTLQGSVSEDLPFKQVFLWVELHSIERIFLGFHGCHESLILRGSCSGDQVPEVLQI